MRSLLFLLILMFVLQQARAQEFIPLWPEGKMPNSKGLVLKDSIVNERIHQVGVPGMYAFITSKEENKGSAVVICPGGGYERLAYNISGFQLAKWFNTIGINAFVLNYRLPNSRDLKERHLGPLQDAQRAMRVIRANAATWKIDPERVGVQGSSAGGHLASTLGTLTDDVSAIGDALDKESFKPDFMILVSPVINLDTYAHAGSKRNLLGEKPSKKLVEKFSTEKQVTAATPPAFLVHAFNDKSVNVRNSLLFYEALLDKNIPSSLHVFPQGGHAIALRNNPGSTNIWTSICELWLHEMGFTPDLEKK
ncbi:alpha/beta hydrolase [Botryobacter ruber]|uniref:alpha/beta hydrolase n=1 Tax=Botryobacter ruber TaxID=2171629 RepID=UPI000E0B36FB|nr:alpha/beta hydrolase [Botryobacter ruber]